MTPRDALAAIRRRIADNAPTYMWREDLFEILNSVDDEEDS